MELHSNKMRRFKFNFLSIFFILNFFYLSHSHSETIVYIDMDKIMQVSKAGKSVINNLNKTNEGNIKKFKKIEEELKKEEKDLVAKRNVLNQEEFEKKLDNLKKKIEKYRSQRQKAIEDVTKKRVNASADFAQKIKPILADYAKENSIDIVIQKKNIIMGKSQLDITDKILKIVDSKISKLETN